MPFDPTTLTLTGFWRASYVSSSSWPGTASAGSSGSSPARDMVPGNVGFAGTAQNGFTPFDGDGASIWLTGSSLPATMQWSDLIGSNANFYIHVVGLFRTASATAGQINDPAFVSDNGGSIGISYSTDGVRAWFYDGVSFQTTPPVAMATNVYKMIQVWYDGTNLNLQINGGTISSVAAANNTSVFAANAVRFGGNFDNPGPGPAVFFDGSILEVATATGTGNANVGTAARRFDMWSYAQYRYALALGWSGVPRIEMPATMPRINPLHPGRFQTTVLGGLPPVNTGMQPPRRPPVRKGVGPMQRLRENPRARVTFDQAQLNAFVSFPDSIARAMMAAALQIEESRAPVQPVTPVTAPTYVASYGPDAARAPVSTHTVASGRAFTVVERTTALATTSFPDAINRVVFDVARQDACDGWPTPERTSTLWWSAFADRVDRPVYPAPAHQPVTGLSPAPERTAAIASEQHADIVPRPWFATSLQLSATETYPAPERTIPAATRVHPDRLDRAGFATFMQMAATELPPSPERPAPEAVRVHQDRVDRPIFAVAHQLSSTELSPKPERTSPLACTLFDDQVRRPVFDVARQQFVSGIAPAPERTAPLAADVHPNRVDRPWFGSHEQQASTELSPAPERTTPLACVVHADAVQRAIATWTVESAFGVRFVPIPSAYVQMVGLTTAPDAVDRRTMPAGQHMAMVGSFVPPSAAQFVLSVQLATMPATIDARWFGASQQLASARHPQPIVAVTYTPINLTVAPDATRRPPSEVASGATASRAPEQKLPTPCVVSPSWLSRTTPQPTTPSYIRADATVPIVDVEQTVFVFRPNRRVETPSVAPTRVDGSAPQVIFADATIPPRRVTSDAFVTPPRQTPVVLPPYSAAFFADANSRPSSPGLIVSGFVGTLLRGTFITVAFNADGIARVTTAEAVALIGADQATARTDASESTAITLSSISIARILEDE